MDALKKIEALENITIPAGLIVLGVFLLILTVVGCIVAFKEKLVGLIFVRNLSALCSYPKLFHAVHHIDFDLTDLPYWSRWWSLHLP